MKTYYFIATFLICNILFGCSYHCKRELESFRQKNRDWAVVGVWEECPESGIRKTISFTETDVKITVYRMLGMLIIR